MTFTTQTFTTQPFTDMPTIANRPAYPAAMQGGSPALPGMRVRALGTNSCPCHNAAAASRDLVAALARSTTEATDHMRAAVARSAAIEWEGKAAAYFREHLHADAVMSVHIDEAVYATQSVLWQGGAS